MLLGLDLDFELELNDMIELKDMIRLESDLITMLFNRNLIKCVIS